MLVLPRRKSFLELLEKGLMEEFSKRNPISNQNLEVFFYPEYYQLTPPEYNPRRAILLSKSYSSQLFIPVQLTDKKNQKTIFKWILIGNLPLMTKRGHFVLNGAPRVIVNQILRSPGIYYTAALKEIFSEKWSEKPEITYKCYYTDLICLRGTWLRIEIDKNKDIWAQMKKVPKIPLLWFLLAMGLTERIILKSVINPTRLLANFSTDIKRKMDYEYVTNPYDAWKQISFLISSKGVSSGRALGSKAALKNSNSVRSTGRGAQRLEKVNVSGKRPLEGISSLLPTDAQQAEDINEKSGSDLDNFVAFLWNADSGNNQHVKEGRNWIFKRFMNPRAYDLGTQGRLNFNKKLGLCISSNQTTLTAQDVLFATDYLLKVEKGLKNIDDIDHLKNRRVRTSGELLQLQIGIGLVRLEKIIREKLSKQQKDFKLYSRFPASVSKSKTTQKNQKVSQFKKKPISKQQSNLEKSREAGLQGRGHFAGKINLNREEFKLNNLINTKAFNGALREFFGTSQLSQFMDQLNPLAEITHKRRLSSMGPGGVTRDSATLAIRGIHPTHYGRICPIETPEGKNTGLVNSLTTYARANSRGFLESPFYKVFKGQIQKNLGIFFLSAEQEEKIKLAAADLSISSIGFLPKSKIPAKIAYGDTISQISRNIVEYIGVSPIQMISVATSLIPFLEHDDANRALMGSNMQRQAVPLIRAERPLVGTGLESRAVSDSGHAISAKYSGYVSYVSAKKIVIYTIPLSI